MISRQTAAAFVLLILAPSLVASDRKARSELRPLASHGQNHFGSSPFPPPKGDDTLFAVDTSVFLDTPCAYRSDGPLVIQVPVTRHVGAVDGRGTLQSAQSLIGRGYISANAHLRFPAFDVDVYGDPFDSRVPPEIDRVYFNGHLLGSLTGDDEIWKLNEFLIPIEWIKFPQKGAGGSAPAPAMNELRIEIDAGSSPDENWCTSIDWVEVDFAAIAPIFLVHGIISSGASAWGRFNTALTAAGVPFSRDINVSPVGSIEGNAIILASQLRAAAAAYGAKKCHIVAHSKGGLDTRAYLNGRYDPDELRVLSVYTISTPHHGTILADIGVLAAAGVATTSPTGRVLLQTLPFAPDLSAVSMFFFNRRYPRVPAGILFYNYAGDPDADQNHIISDAEAAELMPGAAATVFYNIIGNQSPVKVTVTTTQVRVWGEFSFPSIDIDITRTFTKNDVAVSVASAHSPFGTYIGPDRVANHANIKSEPLADEILRRILADFPNR